MKKYLKKFVLLSIVCMLFLTPVFSLDLDSTVNDNQRKNYSKTQKKAAAVQQQTQGKQQSQVTKPVQTVTKREEQNIKPTVEIKQVIEEPKKTVIKQDLPTVPSLPAKATSPTVVKINKQYSGKVPNENAIIPCNDIKVSDLIIDTNVVKAKTAKATSSKQKRTTAYSTSKYRTVKLARGTQFRAICQTKITDYLREGNTVVFTTTQQVRTPYLTIPQNTKLTARVVDAHEPQMSCNGGLVGLRIVSANINGYNQTLKGGIIKIKTDNIYFSNLKGEHTYWKTTCKKAKWGQNIFSKWSRTSRELANNGAGVIIAPFPYIGGCILSAASTISSPVTALLGKGGHLSIPAKTAFTIKLYDDAYIRY